LNASNTYTGGTDIKAGTLKLGADKALGTGNVTMSGGTLDMNGKVLTNYISAKGSVKVLNGGNYGGNFVLDGTLADGSSLRVNSGKTATLKSGTVSGKFSGAGKVVKSSSGTVTFKGVNNCAGGTDITAGTLVLGTNNALGTGKVTMSGGTLNMNSKSLSNYIAAKGSTNILNGGNFNGNYELSGNLGSNSSLRINSGKKATLRSGTMSGSLTGAGETIIAGKVNLNGGRIKTNKLTVNGSGRQLTANSSGLSMNKSASVITLASQGRLNSAGAITAKNIELSGSSVLNAKNSTARSIDLGGTLKATSSTVSLYGNLTAANVTLNNAVLTDEGSSTSAVKVTGTASVSNNAKFNIKGYLTGKNLTLSKGKLKQYGHTNGVSLSGTLSMNSGSSLTTSGTLSAGTMTLSGGTINLTAGSLKTITVNNTLTLNSAIDLNLGCSLKQGVSYKLVSFKKTNLTKTSNLASLLGMSGSGATLTLGSNSITLKVTNSTAWNKYVAANKSLFSSATTAMMPEVEEEEVAEEILTTSVSETTEAVAAFDRSGADALVQSNWGMLNASRAFTDTIGNRASNRRALGEEQKSSVWMSAMGASSRLSSDGVAAGSDYNLFGAAFGMEQQLTEKSSLGLAIGNSRGKVSSFTSGRTKQDTLHTALYGQHLLQQSTSDALTLDWSAAYGRTESRWNGMEWDRRALQLDVRATYAHQLNDKTTVSAFAGLQYYASDSATVAQGCESGSIQNLRGEIGVGIGHRATSKTSIYGELSFVGDMARNNPTATIGEHRVRGANPGRAGINLSAGVNHALNEKWSVNASYNMELMERANSHSANIGASYKF
ncbi:MAG: autotransporter domain-containing protein, partial [Akkermansia sp.]|nr:autotransporter domain-containing protein [Akkermansia sp.]